MPDWVRLVYVYMFCEMYCLISILLLACPPQPTRALCSLCSLRVLWCILLFVLSVGCPVINLFNCSMAVSLVDIYTFVCTCSLYKGVQHYHLKPFLFTRLASELTASHRNTRGSVFSWWTSWWYNSDCDLSEGSMTLVTWLKICTDEKEHPCPPRSPFPQHSNMWLAHILLPISVMKRSRILHSPGEFRLSSKNSAGDPAVILSSSLCSSKLFSWVEWWGSSELEKYLPATVYCVVFLTSQYCHRNSALLYFIK